MRAIAFNGSPRKRHNTGLLLEAALDGAAEAGWETEMVHLYDLMYKGCISCFACKTTNGGSYGKCAMCDDLTPLLEKTAAADMLLLGSPIYLGTETGQMRAFLERLIFPHLVYAKEPTSLFARPIRTAFIYTTGIAEKDYALRGLDRHISTTAGYMTRIFGHHEALFYGESKQFDNPEKIFAPGKDIAYLEKHHAEVFPQKLEEARTLGRRLANTPIE